MVLRACGDGHVSGTVAGGRPLLLLSCRCGRLCCRKEGDPRYPIQISRRPCLKNIMMMKLSVFGYLGLCVSWSGSLCSDLPGNHCSSCYDASSISCEDSSISFFRQSSFAIPFLFPLIPVIASSVRKPQICPYNHTIGLKTPSSHRPDL